MAVSGGAFAKGPGGGGGGGGGGRPGGESAGNNLSFPVIFSDGVVPGTYLEVLKQFSPITGDVTLPTVCAQEDNTTVPLPTDILCYYGRQNLGISEETGERIWFGDPKVWWLQERVQNKWQAHDPKDPNTAESLPVVVSAVDWGDLLESGSLITRQIRTEFAMYKNVIDDAEYGDEVDTRFGGTCDSSSDPSLCFVAYEMSGAVPGTDQSINEIQGNSFGPGEGQQPGTQVTLDPTLIKFGNHATVYSACARFLIQPVTVPGTLSWSTDAGQWITGAGEPIVEVSTYGGDYGAEVNAGGSMIYGYNWNATGIDPGRYRLTFVLDGEGRCGYPLKTMFDDTTQMINTGEVAAGVVVSHDALMLLGGNGSEGGLAYVDITVKTKGGGKPRP
jgi:hypothetical protein